MNYWVKTIYIGKLKYNFKSLIAKFCIGYLMRDLCAEKNELLY